MPKRSGKNVILRGFGKWIFGRFLDPEDLRGTIAAYDRCCTELIERHGRFVAKYG